jgi:hypothetical protein
MATFQKASKTPPILEGSLRRPAPGGGAPSLYSLDRQILRRQGLAPVPTPRVGFASRQRLPDGFTRLDQLPGLRASAVERWRREPQALSRPAGVITSSLNLEPGAGQRFGHRYQMKGTSR